MPTEEADYSTIVESLAPPLIVAFNTSTGRETSELYVIDSWDGHRVHLEDPATGDTYTLQERSRDAGEYELIKVVPNSSTNRHECDVETIEIVGLQPTT